MDDTDVMWALQALGRPAGPGVPFDGSRSGSGVFRVSIEGTEAVLKVSRGDRRRLAPARREADVYLTLAPGLPLRTPRLLDYRDSGDALILLLTAHPSADPPSDWALNDWLRVTRDLAALHSVPPPVGPQWRHGSSLIRELARPDLDRIAGFWEESAEDAGRLAPVLADLPALAAAASALDQNLVHGDCHTANLLRAGDDIVWVDWQEAGLGNPAEDLAFLSVRSVPEGTAPPRDAMLEVYARCRGMAVEPLRRAVLAAELATFVVQWPHYAALNTPTANGRVRARVRELTRWWAIARRS
jgi:Ser/Thr protein kinase RdoA (MazF antagonist)